MAQIRIAVDIGGTFTDLQFLNEHTGATFAHKVPTTPDDPSIGLVSGISEAASRFRFELSDISLIMHGTTIATNAVLQRRLPVGALLTTRGFRDVLEIGRHLRRDIYAKTAERRALLVPRSRRFEVDERVLANGVVETKLGEGSVQAAARMAAEAGAQAVAICFLHAYLDPTHEQRAAEIVQDILPDVFVSCSHQVSPEIREFERTSTTVLNALLMPVVKTYLSKLQDRLGTAGITAPVFLVQSNGGVTTPSVAAEQPARLLLSGPAGGARAAEILSHSLEEPNLVAVDMGGTSYDVSIVADGRVKQVAQGEVDGLPVRLPMIEIRTIGAGGGSIASADGSGRLLVGPDSAGARPGPACYGHGGTDPTVTDANAVLGRLDPDHFLGGAMVLDLDAAKTAISTAVAAPLSMPPDQAAEGILSIAVSKMAGAIRLSLFEKGLDPEDFALISFGGASGLHACETAAEIGSKRVVFPLDPGTLSAWGMLFGDIVHDLARTELMPADDTSVARLTELCTALRSQGQRVLERDGIRTDQRLFPFSLDLRYPGQAYEIGIPFDPDAGIKGAVARFHATHHALFNHSDPSVTPEIVVLRLAATGRLSAPQMHTQPGSETAPQEPRKQVHGPSGTSMPIYERHQLNADTVLQGPLIIEEDHSTHYIPANWAVTVHPSGALIADHEGEGE